MHGWMHSLGFRCMHSYKTKIAFKKCLIFSVSTDWWHSRRYLPIIFAAKHNQFHLLSFHHTFAWIIPHHSLAIRLLLSSGVRQADQLQIPLVPSIHSFINRLQNKMYLPAIPSNFLFILCLLTISPLFVGADTDTIHWEWRDLICQTGEKGEGDDKLTEKPAECTIALRENERDKNRRLGPKGAGCFDEYVNGTTRTYCDVLCPNADTVYLIKRDPQVHRFCFVFYTHKLERRGNKWLLWRQNKCRHSQITFTIRCEFLFKRAQTPSDAELFGSLKKKN